MKIKKILMTLGFILASQYLLADGITNEKFDEYADSPERASIINAFNELANKEEKAFGTPYDGSSGKKYSEYYDEEVEKKVKAAAEIANPLNLGSFFEEIDKLNDNASMKDGFEIVNRMKVELDKIEVNDGNRDNINKLNEFVEFVKTMTELEKEENQLKERRRTLNESVKFSDGVVEKYISIKKQRNELSKKYNTTDNNIKTLLNNINSKLTEARNDGDTAKEDEIREDIGNLLAELELSMEEFNATNGNDQAETEFADKIRNAVNDKRNKFRAISELAKTYTTTRGEGQRNDMTGARVLENRISTNENKKSIDEIKEKKANVDASNIIEDTDKTAWRNALNVYDKSEVDTKVKAVTEKVENADNSILTVTDEDGANGLGKTYKVGLTADKVKEAAGTDTLGNLGVDGNDLAITGDGANRLLGAGDISISLSDTVKETLGKVGTGVISDTDEAKDKSVTGEKIFEAIKDAKTTVDKKDGEAFITVDKTEGEGIAADSYKIGLNLNSLTTKLEETFAKQDSSNITEDTDKTAWRNTLNVYDKGEVDTKVKAVTEKVENADNSILTVTDEDGTNGLGKTYKVGLAADKVKEAAGTNKLGNLGVDGNDLTITGTGTNRLIGTGNISISLSDTVKETLGKIGTGVISETDANKDKTVTGKAVYDYVNPIKTDLNTLKDNNITFKASDNTATTDENGFVRKNSQDATITITEGNIGTDYVENNLKTSIDNNGNLKIGFKKAPKFESIVVGTAATDEENININNNGIDLKNRGITGLTKGKADNEAVNVSQLKPFATALGGGATIDGNGDLTQPTYTLKAGNDQASDYTNVGAGLTALDEAIVKIKDAEFTEKGKKNVRDLAREAVKVKADDQVQNNPIKVRADKTQTENATYYNISIDIDKLKQEAGLASGEVEDGNNDTVTGDKVYDAIKNAKTLIDKKDGEQFITIDKTEGEGIAADSYKIGLNLNSLTTKLEETFTKTDASNITSDTHKAAWRNTLNIYDKGEVDTKVKTATEKVEVTGDLLTIETKDGEDGLGKTYVVGLTEEKVKEAAGTNKLEKKIKDNKIEINKIKTDIGNIQLNVDEVKLREDINKNTANINRNTTRINHLENKVNDLENKMDRGISQVAAMTVFDTGLLAAGEYGIGAGVATHNSTQSVAVGAAYAVSDNFKITTKIAATPGKGKGSYTAAVGAFYKFSR